MALPTLFLRSDANLADIYRLRCYSMFSEMISYSCRRGIINSISNVQHFSTAHLASLQTNPKLSASRASQSVIEIPDKIRRSPVAILQALSETVGRDPTGAHYKFIDDPYFLGTTSAKRKQFATSKEMGRKAARWLVAEWPTLFMYSHDQPRLDAFRPKKTPLESDETGSTEMELLERISQSYIRCAMKVYQNGIDKGTEFSWEAKLALLEALCFHNVGDPPDPLWPEELATSHGSHGRGGGDQERAKWMGTDHPAEDLYLSIIDASESAPAEVIGKAHAAFIAGLAKWGEAERALQVMKDNMAGQDAVLPATCLRHVLHAVRNRGSGDEAMQLAVKLVADSLAKSSFTPDIDIFNELLFIAGRHRNRDGCEFTVRLASDIRRLGVEPTLTTYRLIMRNLQFTVNFRDYFYNILDEVQNKSFEVHEPEDSYFFKTALDMAIEMNDLRAVYRIYDLSYFGSNGAFLSDPLRETQFLDQFLTYLRQNDEPDNFMKVYKSLVPLTFTPRTDFFTATLSWIEHNQLYHFIPVFWSDFIMTSAGTQNGNQVMNQFLSLMESAHSHLPQGGKIFVDVARTLISHLDLSPPGGYGRHRSREDIDLPHGAWNESYVNVAVLLLARGGEVDDCLAFMKRYIEAVLIEDPKNANVGFGRPTPPKPRYADRADEGKRRIGFSELLLPPNGSLLELIGLFLNENNAGKIRTMALVEMIFDHGHFSCAPEALPGFSKDVKRLLLEKFTLKPPETQWFNDIIAKFESRVPAAKS